MKKIFTVITMAVIMLGFGAVNTAAAAPITVTNDAGKEFVSGDTICANRTYSIPTTAPYNEILILDSKTHMILDVLSANGESVDLVFPENATNVDVVLTPYTADKKLDYANENKISLVVEPCDYEATAAEYVYAKPLADVTYDGTNINVSMPTGVEGYNFDYQFLGEHTKTLKANDAIPVKEVYIFQFHEAYTENGAKVEKFYELEINPTTKTYFIRPVDSFEMKTISVLDVINKKLLVVLIILITMIVIVSKKIKKEKKKYRNEKINVQLEKRKR